MKCRLLLMIVVLLIAPAIRAATPTTPATTPAAENIQSERWFQILLSDQPAGSMHVWETREGSEILTHSEVVVTIRRGGVELQIEVDSRFTETIDGKPLRAKVRQKLGAMAIDQEMVFKDDSIEMISHQAGQDQRQSVPVAPADREWLAPAAASRYVEKQLAAHAKEIKFWTLDPTAGPKRFEATMTMTGEENVEVMGKVVHALVCNQTMSIMPGVVTKAYIDEKGNPVKTTMNLIPGMAMTVVESDEALAKAQVSAPELMAATFIKPDKPIKNPRECVSAVFEIAFASPKKEKQNPPAANAKETSGIPTLPRTGAQRVIWGDDHTARVVVDLSTPVNPGDDLPTDDNRRATEMLNWEDPKVKELVTKAMAGQPKDLSPVKKAELLRRFVHHFIEEKDLSVGFASASEVARTAEGDCTEHGVLLAALLRGAGVPSRTVTGLVYVDNFMGHEGIFGYHMWSQAWIGAKDGGYWLDVDATLGDETPFDAAHIALATSAMTQSGAMNDMVKLVPLFGRVTIRVIDAAERPPGTK